MTVAIHVCPSGLHGRLRALQSELRRIFHDRLDLLLEFFDLGLGQMSGLNHVRRQVADIVGSDFGQFGLRWVAELDLSDRRAHAVQKYLEDKGVDPKRLSAQGYGETQPIDRAHNEAAWAKNRRVAFLILKRATD